MPDEFHQAFFICKTDASNKLQKENLLNQMKAFPKINYCEVYDPSTTYWLPVRDPIIMRGFVAQTYL